MKTLLVLTAVSLFSLNASANRIHCELVVKDAVDKASKKHDENSSAIDAKRLSTIPEDSPTPAWGSYEVLVSDESGACVWYAVANEKHDCKIETIKDAICY